MKQLLISFLFFAGCMDASAQEDIRPSEDDKDPRATLTRTLQQRRSGHGSFEKGLFPFLKLDSIIAPDYSRKYYTYDEQGRVTEFISHAIPTPDPDDDNPDSIYYQVRPLLRQLTNYAPQELTVTNYDWNSASVSWELSLKYVYTFDVSDQLIQSVTYKWVAADGAWEGRGRITYADTPEGYDEIYETWDTSLQVWAYDRNWSYLLNEEGLVTQRTYYRWNEEENTWGYASNSSRYHYVYDEHGREIEEVVTKWIPASQTWKNSTRYTHAYHESGQVSDYAMYYWFSATAAWRGSTRRTYAYQPDNDLVLIELYFFDPELGEWLYNHPEYGYEYAYNTAGEIIEKTKFDWYSHEQRLVENFRETFAYDSLGNITDYASFRWYGENLLWRGTGRKHYTYDPATAVADLIFPGNASYAFLFERSRLVSETHFNFDYSTNDWAINHITTYYFSGFITDTEEAPAAEALKLFPNPVNNVLQFILPFNGSASYAIHDLNGRILQAEKAWNGSSIDVSKLPAGSYVICLREGNRVMLSKFIKH